MVPDIIKIVCTLAIGHSVFLAVIIWTINRQVSNRILSILLILLSIRIGKSLVGLFWSTFDYPLSILGLLAMAWAGPSVFLFIQPFFQSEKKLPRAWRLHFLLGILPLPFLLIPNWAWLNMFYHIVSLHFILYVLFSLFHLLRKKNILMSDDLRWRWSIYFLTGLCAIAITYVLQLVLYEPFYYALNILISTLVLYILSGYSFRTSKIFLEPPRKSEDSDLFNTLGKQIQVLFERQEIFIDPQLSVSKLAARLNCPPYLASRVVNHFFKQTFSEVLLHYRIQKSEILLVQKGELFSIEGIAYESGFNSLSSFYTSFKKVHGITPAQFRKSRGSANLRVS